MLDDFLSAKDACEWASISRRTLTNRIRSGDISHEYRGRLLYVSKTDLGALYAGNDSKKLPENLPATAVTQELLTAILAELREIKEVNMALAREVARLSGDGLPAVAKGCQETTLKTAKTLPPAKYLDGNKLESKAGNEVAISSNEQRAEDAKKRLFAALAAMDEIPKYRGKPSITGIYRITGIDRGTISKYIAEYEANQE